MREHIEANFQHLHEDASQPETAGEFERSSYEIKSTPPTNDSTTTKPFVNAKDE